LTPCCKKITSDFQPKNSVPLINKKARRTSKYLKKKQLWWWNQLEHSKIALNDFHGQCDDFHGQYD